MRLYIVQTGDGPVYFQGARQAQASELATQMVLEDDAGRYDQEDKGLVRAALEARDWDRLWEQLLGCQAVKIGYTRS